MIWVMKHPHATPEMLGYIPSFLSESDPRSAVEQFKSNYIYGDWNRLPNLTMSADGWELHYPGDPPQPLLAETRLRDEIIRFYDCSWVAVVQPDGTYQLCRMD